MKSKSKKMEEDLSILGSIKATFSTRNFGREIARGNKEEIMKTLKIKYCNEVLKDCFYLRDNFGKLQYECKHPEIINKSQNSRFISKYKLNIEIPKWCQLEDYKENDKR